jgi:hypothetical protein
VAISISKGENLTMPTPKVCVLLWMYRSLLKDGYLKRKEAQSLFPMSVMSFHRYVRSLREYLKVYEKGSLLVFKKRQDVYRLVNTHVNCKE